MDRDVVKPVSLMMTRRSIFRKINRDTGSYIMGAKRELLEPNETINEHDFMGAQGYLEVYGYICNSPVGSMVLFGL